MDFQDQTLVCRDCGKEFVWTAGEQEFYKQKGFDNKPTRCPDCRKNKKRDQNGGGGGDRGFGPRKMYEITCSNCGAKDTVPFQPKEGREVLCRNCFQKARQ
ncbi:MAG: zinc-binding protein [Candidatus Levybacteria bacterium CG_4_10_14_0_2_um_filter_36_16]|nr:MAG: zinc-binding protein [Candidatus Levybacteria bacterium CG_4_10_14_0_2_um_filter_36_16]